MSGFENKLQAASLAILRRELSENERVEFLELVGAMGISSVEDLLYMIMVFKRNEDRVGESLASFQEKIHTRFDEMSALERKIDEKLEASITRILGEGAQAIGRNMGDQIGREASNALTSHKEYCFLQGQTAVAGVIMVISAVAYFLGATLGFGTGSEQGLLEYVLRLPAGLVILLCGTLYVALWSSDFWWQIQIKKLYKVRFVLQILVLMILLIYILTVAM